MAKIDSLFNLMLESEASDLHLSSKSRPRLRIHGSMVEVQDHEVLTAEKVIELVEEITPPLHFQEFKERWDADFAYQLGDQARFRSNLFFDIHGPCAVFRTIPTSILTVEDLELSKEVISLCSLPKGLVLVTGPTGSGKSTTLAALIDQINRTRSDHVITIEDPVEFTHENKRCLINQRQVHEHTRSFKAALRAALREDPDIVLIGELRDTETTEIAMETAETGHLVFGTLHTTTASSTVDRIIDQFPADRHDQIRVMLSTTLRSVISQTLLKRADGKARVGAFEILMVTSAVSALIREGKTYQIPSVIQTGGKHGMMSQNAALHKLVQRRLVTFEEAMNKSVDREGLERLLPDHAIRYRSTMGRGMTFSTELGMPIKASAESEGEGQDTGLSQAETMKAAAQAASAPAQGAGGGMDDFENFRNRLAEKKKKLK